MITIRDFPFAQELITDTTGQIRKVILDFDQYQRLIEALENEGLYHAMMETQHEKPLSKDEALALLEEE
jgi:hypothetical protein